MLAKPKSSPTTTRSPHQNREMRKKVRFGKTKIEREREYDETKKKKCRERVRLCY